MLLDRQECRRRLQLVFPRSSFDTVASNPLAGAAVYTFLHAGAVAPDTGSALAGQVYLRPTATLFMSDAAAARQNPEDRLAWQAAVNAMPAKRAVQALHDRWGVPFEPWYGDNNRETLRDEIFRLWQECGAVRQLPGLAVTASTPRWAITQSFADLFTPDLLGSELATAITLWQSQHLDANALVRIQTAQVRETRAGELEVMLPGGKTRSLEPGVASLIAKGVVELWAPIRLEDPVVLAISQPGDKLYGADAKVLRSLKIRLEVSRLLPDLIVADIRTDGPVTFWLVEVVATDGPVTTQRKAQLTAWATANDVRADSLRFLSAFESRGAAPARRRLKDLAEGTYAWFLDEPTRELSWHEIGT